MQISICRILICMVSGGDGSDNTGWDFFIIFYTQVEYNLDHRRVYYYAMSIFLSFPYHPY